MSSISDAVNTAGGHSHVSAASKFLNPENLIFDRRFLLNNKNVTFNATRRSTFRLPHGAEAQQDLPGVLLADHRRRNRRPPAVPGEQRPRVAPDPRHVLPVHAAAHHLGRWLLHAQSAVLRPSRNDTAVRRPWDYI